MSYDLNIYAQLDTIMKNGSNYSMYSNVCGNVRIHKETLESNSRNWKLTKWKTEKIDCLKRN